MNELALFAGAGGGILGGHLLGWRTVCAVEWEPYPASVLLARQNDGLLPAFPVWDDVQTFDGRPWRGIVDVVSGGFPCQDISVAGNGDGLDGERSGMWREMARIIGEVRPRYAFVENSPMLVTRGLERVLADLTAMGYDNRWGVISASDIGANHRRDRIWIVGKMADSKKLFSNGCNDNARIGLERKTKSEFRNDCWKENLGNAKSAIFTPCFEGQRQRQSWRASGGPAQWWEAEPDVGRVADGVAARVDRLKAIGNGQVSEVARRAWEILSDQR